MGRDLLHSKKQGHDRNRTTPSLAQNRKNVNQTSPTYPYPYPQARSKHTSCNRQLANPPKPNLEPTSTMIIPVRCFSCGKVSKSTPTPQPKESTTNFHAKQVVGNLWAQYLKSIEEGFPNADDMDKERYAIHLLYHHPRSKKQKKRECSED
jgi:DNA-directed RNA polymerase subunit N (RpoN/RPB10)